MRLRASTAYGDLNNFDTVNDTGQDCHGFEIEIDDIHSTDITYTYDWNHYGAPKIREDNSRSGDIPRCSSATRARRTPTAAGRALHGDAAPRRSRRPTATAAPIPSVNDGCEHFGVGYYGAPTAIRYNWLVDDGAGNLVLGRGCVARRSWRTTRRSGRSGAAACPPTSAQPPRSWPRFRRRWSRFRPASSSASRPG